MWVARDDERAVFIVVKVVGTERQANLATTAKGVGSGIASEEEDGVEGGGGDGYFRA